MPYEIAWDEAVPGGSVDGSSLDDHIRNTRKAIRERLAAGFGGMSLAEFQADPFKLKGLRGGADADFDIWGGTARTTIRDAAGGNEDLVTDHATGDTTARRDLVATRHIVAAGGFRQLLTGWRLENVPQATTNAEVPRPAGRAIMARAGSITGLTIAFDPGQIVGNFGIYVEVMKTTIVVSTGVRTDTATGLIATMNTHQGGGRAWAVVTQAVDTDTFVAGDEIWLRYTTDALFLPNGTADLNCNVEIET